MQVPVSSEHQLRQTQFASSHLALMKKHQDKPFPWRKIVIFGISLQRLITLYWKRVLPQNQPLLFGLIRKAHRNHNKRK